MSSSQSDQPTLLDSLLRLPLVNKLAREVMECAPPRVFGVHGDWGAGKTSFLHQLHYTLDGIPSRKDWAAEQLKLVSGGFVNPTQLYEKSEDAVVVWFEAWRYQHEPAPVVALLHEMRGQLGRLIRAKNWFKKIGEVTLCSALLQLEQIAKFAWLQSAAGITTVGKGSGLATTIQEQGERWEREHLAEKLPAEALREQLEYAIKQCLGRQKGKDGERRRVVVLIDDLDRCEPQAAFRLLEGIKIYLNIPNCVFVLGMDQRIIEDAISESVPGADDDADLARRRAREYLEKVFQAVYQLPIVQDVPDHLVAWLLEGETAISSDTGNTIRLLLIEYPGCVPANPRKIKAFAAVLRRFLTEPNRELVGDARFEPLAGYSGLATRHPYESLALILASCYHFHPQIYRVLEAHLDAFYEGLWEWCGRDKPEEQKDHPCMLGLGRAYVVRAPVGDRPAITLPEMYSLHADYSRGDIFRVQKLLYEARPFTRKQILALLLT